MADWVYVVVTSSLISLSISLVLVNRRLLKTSKEANAIASESLVLLARVQLARNDALAAKQKAMARVAELEIELEHYKSKPPSKADMEYVRKSLGMS